MGKVSFSFCVTKDMRDSVEICAKKEGISNTEFIIRAVCEYSGIEYKPITSSKIKSKNGLKPINRNMAGDGYYVWADIVKRCYSKKKQIKNPSYVGTSMCDEWMDFKVFSDFYKNNLPNINNIDFNLDKDLLQQNIKNKIYSPETCVFLPKSVNTFLANKYSNNTSGYTGVRWRKDKNKWQASIGTKEIKTKHLGYFKNIEEASMAYQSARAIEAEKVKSYLRSLNYLPEHIIQLVK